ncbi:MAG: methyltransferase domain-containing protein, partial [Proteobacteria bacterium]|nr:methyltransferase domain-containing protein [Pseudomonadota bacterium]
DEAAAAYRAALRLDPDHVHARFYLQAATGAAGAAAMPAALVAALFDGYADRFDAHVQNVLAYRMPALLRQAYADAGGSGPADILDLGCGTGLCGVAFADLARRLVGVDLSPVMVAKARQRGLYTELYAEDMLVTLRREAGAYDLVIAADVFVYVGDLEPVAAAARAALRPAGWFLFSTELGEGDVYRLRPSGRFAHGPGYLHSLATRHGLQMVQTQTVDLRLDSGRPVRGTFNVLRRNKD